MPVDTHDLDEDGEHDPGECELCIETNGTVACDCRCGKCCENLLIDASLRDAEREPRIAELGRPIEDDMATGVRELIGYYLNGLSGHCVFFDPESRLCTIHDTRPLCCRVFNCDDPDKDVDD